MFSMFRIILTSTDSPVCHDPDVLPADKLVEELTERRPVLKKQNF